MTYAEQAVKAVSEFKWDGNENYVPCNGELCAVIHMEYGPYSIGWNCFKYGFIKGMRAEKARQKKAKKGMTRHE